MHAQSFPRKVPRARCRKSIVLVTLSVIAVVTIFTTWLTFSRNLSTPIGANDVTTTNKDVSIFSSQSLFNNTKKAAGTSTTTVPVVTTPDPFFTNTPKRLRLCRSHNPPAPPPTSHQRKATNINIKLLFVEEAGLTNSSEAVKFNLIQSLKRNSFVEYEILQVEHKSSVSQKLFALGLFMRDWDAQERYTHLLVSTSTNLLLGAPPQQLLSRLTSTSQVIFARSALDNDISLHPFVAFGKISNLLNFIDSVHASFERRRGAEVSKLVMEMFLKKHVLWKLRVDSTMDILGHTTTSTTSTTTSTTTSSRRSAASHTSALRTSSSPPPTPTDSPLWLLKTQESPSELGGGGLGRTFCLVTRASASASASTSGACSHAHPLPDVLLFPSSPSPLDAAGYNFLTSNYLSAAPRATPSFSTWYNRREVRLVASLTTLPHRMAHLAVTLNSLVSQHVKPDVIYLNIPNMYSRFNNTSPDTSQLARLRQEFDNKYGVPLVVNSLVRDLGPLSKLLPTLQAERAPDTLIITVDDDMAFKPTLFGILLQRHLNSPDLAFGSAGQLIDVDGDGSTHVRTAWRWKDGAYAVDILEGFTGVIYRRDFFDVRALAKVPAECIFTDDVWISAHLAQRGVPRVKIALGWGDTAEFTANDKIAPLREGNVEGDRRNDACAARLLHHFRPSWLRQHPGTQPETCSFEFRTI